METYTWDQQKGQQRASSLPVAQCPQLTPAEDGGPSRWAGAVEAWGRPVQPRLHVHHSRAQVVLKREEGQSPPPTGRAWGPPGPPLSAEGEAAPG